MRDAIVLVVALLIVGTGCAVRPGTVPAPSPATSPAEAHYAASGRFLLVRFERAYSAMTQAPSLTERGGAVVTVRAVVREMEQLRPPPDEAPVAASWLAMTQRYDAALDQLALVAFGSDQSLALAGQRAQVLLAEGDVLRDQWQAAVHLPNPVPTLPRPGVW